MKKIPGVLLDKVIDTLTVEQLSRIASQLKSILAQLRSVESLKNARVRFRGGLFAMRFPHYMWPRNMHSRLGASESFLIITAKYSCYFAGNSTESLLSRILPYNSRVVIYFQRISLWKDLASRAL